MNDHHTLSVFTPSNSSPEDLESILVQRESLIQDAVERIKESALSDHKHHLLFVGPRGCGKTFFLTLVIHRTSQDTELENRLRIAWLNEDETCTTLLEFLIKTHTALEKRYPEEFRSDALDPAYEMKPDDALDFVSKHLLSMLGSRTLMVAVENLDAFFENLGPQGQKHLRSFIQENPRFCLVATAQRLVESLANRNNPFYGFFQTEHLKPLNVDEAVDLLEKIARLDGKNEVVEFLASRRGRARVRALHHLSGGNHRIYIVLSRFVTKENIDALVGPFMKMVDELTPYYQERVRWLAPLQRKIVEYLCTCETTVPVKEISKRLFSSQQTISSQLQSLREKGYVESNQRGRESLYEISEPLMRICVEVKENQRNKPLRLLVDFLRVWYDNDELSSRIGLPACAAAAKIYLSTALEKNISEGSLRKKLYLKELMQSLPESLDPVEVNKIATECGAMHEAQLLAIKIMVDGHPEEAIHCLNDEIAHTTAPDEKAQLLLSRAGLHDALKNAHSEMDDYTAVIGLSGAPADQVAKALFNRGVCYGQQGDNEREIDDYTAVIGLSGVPADQVSRALFNRGITYGQRGEDERAIKDYTAVIGLSGAPADQVAKVLFNRGVRYGQQGDNVREIDDYTAVIGLSGAPADQVAMALFNRGITYGQQGENERAIKDYTAVIALSDAPVDQVAMALVNRGVRYGQQGDNEREIDDYTAVIELSGAPADEVAMALFNRGITYGQRGDNERAIEDYTAVIGLSGAPANQVAKALFNRGVRYGQRGDNEREIEDYTAVIGLSGAPADQVAMALFNRGITYGQRGDDERAIKDYTAVIGLSGAPTDQVAKALVHRGITYGQQGDNERAVEDYTAVIGLSGAPADQVAVALFNRGVQRFHVNEWLESREDFDSVNRLETAPNETIVDSHIALAELNWKETKWEKGFASLDSGLKKGSEIAPAYAGSPEDLIQTIFDAGFNVNSRLNRIEKMVKCYQTYQMLPKLGDGVVKHLGSVFLAGEPFPSSDNLQQWLSTWEQTTGDLDELRLPLRILRVGIDFIKAGGKDESILLTLTSTEREILKQALGLPEKQ